MMNKVYLRKTGNALLKTPVSSSCANKATSNTEYYDEETGKLIGVIFNKFLDHSKIYNLLLNVKFPKSDRLSGMQSMSQVFGTGHRDPLKNLPTRSVAFNRNYPHAYLELLRIMAIFESKLATYPEILKAHEEYRDSIPQCWRVGSGLFSSGIINQNTKLLYHTDNGNAQGCYSFMLVIKKGVEGGDLHLPEYDIELPLADGDVVFFDGANVSHGVTPFRLMTKDSKRYTIVFYTNEKLKKAKPSIKEEFDFMNESITKTIMNRKRK